MTRKNFMVTSKIYLTGLFPAEIAAIQGDVNLDAKAKEVGVRRNVSDFLSTVIILLTGCTPLPALETAKAHQQPANVSKAAGHEAFGTKYMIATQGEAASRAGAKMFELGGNAIDAAAAISFAIAVERPQSTGIGGGGFMLIHLAEEKNIVSADFRERAPLKAYETMYQDKKGEVIPRLSVDGILAAAVPGMVAGVLEIHERYGKLERKEILTPAIELAENGFAIYDHLARAIKARKDLLAQSPAAKAIFLKADGEPLEEGDWLKQPNLAKTLKTIAKNGRAGFYSGWVAEALVKEEQRLGGLITQQDLDSYEVKFRQPIQGSYEDYEIYSMPPPSSGGVHVVQILNILEGKLESTAPNSARNMHLTASAMQMAFADRARYLGDTDFVEVPLTGLTSKEYAKKLYAQIPADQARASKVIEAGEPTAKESNETTHFTVMDIAGNVVTSTQTINGWLGSTVVVPGTGFLLNNEMDDFSAKPGVANMFGAIGGRENAIEPGKRPLSSMSPTIVMKEGKPVMALGSPAGTRIITCVTLTMLNYLEYDKGLYEAVAAPRYHHQWLPDEIRVEEDGFEEATLAELESMGYKINRKDYGCKVQAIAREGKRLHGVSDPRGAGLSIGR